MIETLKEILSPRVFRGRYARGENRFEHLYHVLFPILIFYNNSEEISYKFKTNKLSIFKKN